MIVVNPHTTRNVVRIETIAIMIGTIARNEANTKASTSRAPNPPSSASTSTPGPLPPPLWTDSASNPVRCTGEPPTVMPLRAAVAFLAASGLSLKACLGSGGGYATTNVVRLSCERNAALWVLA